MVYGYSELHAYPKSVLSTSYLDTTLKVKSVFLKHGNKNTFFYSKTKISTK